MSLPVPFPVCPVSQGSDCVPSDGALVLEKPWLGSSPLPNIHMRGRGAWDSVRSWSLRSCRRKALLRFCSRRLSLAQGPAALQPPWVHGAVCVGICQPAGASGAASGQGELLPQPLALTWLWLSYPQCPCPWGKPPRSAPGVAAVLMAGISRRHLAVPLSL